MMEVEIPPNTSAVVTRPGLDEDHLALQSGQHRWDPTRCQIALSPLGPKNPHGDPTPAPVRGTNDSILPGRPWLDTSGQRIQAHGGSIHYDNGTFFSGTGENKEHTVPGSGVWHWGVRWLLLDRLVQLRSDLGLIIPARRG